ncbi:hypothetical protein CONPUDRAFT_168178 [Coniophora puteana RWD-64-598 SS2]|uniref:Uncharacterized protein n=1 Tax=Coniophora puteana (strain RWD-64-598) TaxID=741705 RepID=A0A5M3MD87_CONPW|nr:uncharacterized protein CONPUDRAFT_168178 [Coniophora puteana RWD-64-598 SS2]EIW77188.1 hypothetical protein CONPUDRAFT_168178 [Coniophora puteana RWD-64-598 SS2]
MPSRRTVSPADATPRASTSRSAAASTIKRRTTRPGTVLKVKTEPPDFAKLLSATPEPPSPTEDIMLLSGSPRKSKTKTRTKVTHGNTGTRRTRFDSTAPDSELDIRNFDLDAFSPLQGQALSRLEADYPRLQTLSPNPTVTPRPSAATPRVSKSSKRKTAHRSPAAHLLHTPFKTNQPNFDKLLSATPEPPSPGEDPMLLSSKPKRKKRRERATPTPSPRHTSSSLPAYHESPPSPTPTPTPSVAPSDAIPLSAAPYPSTSSYTNSSPLPPAFAIPSPDAVDADAGWSDDQVDDHATPRGYNHTHADVDADVNRDATAADGEGTGEYTGRYTTVRVPLSAEPPSPASAGKERVDEWGRPPSPFPYRLRMESMSPRSSVPEDVQEMQMDGVLVEHRQEHHQEQEHHQGQGQEQGQRSVRRRTERELQKARERQRERERESAVPTPSNVRYDHDIFRSGARKKKSRAQAEVESMDIDPPEPRLEAHEDAEIHEVTAEEADAEIDALKLTTPDQDAHDMDALGDESPSATMVEEDANGNGNGHDRPPGKPASSSSASMSSTSTAYTRYQHSKSPPKSNGFAASVTKTPGNANASLTFSTSYASAKTPATTARKRRLSRLELLRTPGSSTVLEGSSIRDILQSKTFPWRSAPVEREFPRLGEVGEVEAAAEAVAEGEAEREEQLEEEEEEDESGDETPFEDDDVIKITSGDPHAAARAAAILRLHDYDCLLAARAKSRGKSRGSSVGSSSRPSSRLSTGNGASGDGTRRRRSIAEGGIVKRPRPSLPATAQTNGFSANARRRVTLGDVPRGGGDSELLMSEVEEFVQDPRFLLEHSPRKPRASDRRSFGTARGSSRSGSDEIEKEREKEKEKERAEPRAPSNRWTKDDWKCLEWCLREELAALPSTSVVQSVLDKVAPEDVVERFVAEQGGSEGLSQRGATWTFDDMLLRVEALRKKKENKVAQAGAGAGTDAFLAAAGLLSPTSTSFTSLTPTALRANSAAAFPSTDDALYGPGPEPGDAGLPNGNTLSEAGQSLYARLLDEAQRLEDAGTETTPVPEVLPPSSIAFPSPEPDPDPRAEPEPEPEPEPPASASASSSTSASGSASRSASAEEAGEDETPREHAHELNPHAQALPRQSFPGKVKGVLFSYLPSFSRGSSKVSVADSQDTVTADKDRHNGTDKDKGPSGMNPLPPPPEDRLARARAAAATPARKPIEPARIPSVQLAHASPTRKKQRDAAARRKEARRLVELRHVPAAPQPHLARTNAKQPPAPAPLQLQRRARTSSGASVKDLVRCFEDVNTASVGEDKRAGSRAGTYSRPGSAASGVRPRSAMSMKAGANGKRPVWKP